MSRPARWSLVALCVLLALLGLLQPDRSREFSRTTFGTTPVGYGAVLALLTQLGLPAGRTFAPADALPPEATVWWIEPEGLCRAQDAAPRTRPRCRGAATAGSPPAAPRWCSSATNRPTSAPTSPASRCPRAASSPARIGEEGDRPDRRRADWSAAPRILPLPPLSTFDSPPAPEPCGRCSTASRSCWRCRSAMARWCWSPTPRRCATSGSTRATRRCSPSIWRAPTACRTSTSATTACTASTARVRYLVRSAAVPALLGIVVLGLLVVWHGNLWPARVAAAEPSAGADARRLRRLAGAALRAHRRLPAGRRALPPADRGAPAPPLRTARRDPAADPARPPARQPARGAGSILAPLAAPAAVASAETLAAAVRALDALVEDVTR